MDKEHFSVSQEREDPEKEMVWTIDGSPERIADAVEIVVRHLETSGWNGDRIEDIKKTLSVGIANTVIYANHGDAARSIEIGFSVRGAEGGEGSVEISLTGEKKAAEADSVTDKEAELQDERAGELFVKLPSDVDVTFVPGENKIILKKGEAAAE